MRFFKPMNFRTLQNKPKMLFTPGLACKGAPQKISLTATAPNSYSIFHTSKSLQPTQVLSFFFAQLPVHRKLLAFSAIPGYSSQPHSHQCSFFIEIRPIDKQ